jgi:hypothetical protein
VVEKLRRDSAFTHKVVTARSAETEELFGGVQSTQSSGGSVLYTRSEAQGEGVRREKRNKGRRPLRTWKFFQVWEKVHRKLRRAQQPSDQRRREIWTIDFHVQEELRRSLQKEETVSRRISLRNPVSHWIGRSCTKFSLWSRRAEEVI